MITRLLALTVAAISLASTSMQGQDRTPPTTPAELEVAYIEAIERRTFDILTRLSIQDPIVAKRIHDTIITQYRTLRYRDEAIDKMVETHASPGNKMPAERYAIQQCMSRPLHDHFVAKLSADLTPAQVEIVKDRMTYNKVKITFDAYCEILPKLTEAEKAKILELLKVAREEAMDGGSAQQKSDIFQKHKEEINKYLTAQGHDVAKALQEWTEKQEAARAAQAAAQ